MRDSLLNRRVVLKVGGAGVVGGMMTPSPAGAQTDDGNTGQVNDLTGFETPQPITDGSHRFQLVTPANQLTIDAETNDTIDLVLEWGDSLTVDGGGVSISGSGILTDLDDIGEQRAIFRGEGRESSDIVYDRLTLRGLDTSAVTPGDEVLVEVSARQADSPEDTDSFENVVAAVDDGTFDAEATTEATFEVTQGTLISTNDAETTNLDLAPAVEHTIAFDIDQLRDENAGGTPAGPAKGIIINYFIDDDDGLDFDLADADVTLGGAAETLDLEVVKSREIPGIGQVLLEIADDNTLEDDASLGVGDIVTVELSGLDTADVNPDEFDNASSVVEVGLHGAGTFDPIVNNSIAPDRGAYTIDTVEFKLGDQTGATKIEDWYDLDDVRNNLNDNYILVANLDADTAGYDDIVANPKASEFTESLSFSQREAQATLARTPVDELSSVEGDVALTIVNAEDGIVEREDDSSTESVEVTYTTQDEQFIGFEPIGEVGNNEDLEFTGSFDGQGYEIDELYINRPESENVGLFRQIGDNSVLKNTGLTNIDLTGNNPTGGFVGSSYGGTVTDTYVTGDVDSTDGNVGGLVGYNLNGTVTDSYTTSNVTGSGFHVGGLVGWNNQGEVLDSYTTGSVKSDGNNTGGLIGRNDADSTVTESYTTGTVEGDDSTGGLVGSNDGDITKSYSTAVVSGGVNYAGGLVGNSNDGLVSDSYARGPVDATYYVGGLVGSNEVDSTLTDSYATGTVDGDDLVGGLVGGIGPIGGDDITTSYWDTEASEQETSDGGTGLKTSEMTGESAVDNMEGFDFDTVWDSQVDPDEYPTLQAIPLDEPTANFVVTVVEPTEGAEVREDEQLNVTVEITNSGRESGSQDIALTAPIESTQTAVEIASDDKTQVEFTISESDIQDSFEITVESEDTTDSVSVTAVDPCFIATAAYNTPQADEIDVLRDFRDRVLTNHAVGRAIIKAYYTTSPPVANWIRQTKQRRQVVRKYFVEPLVRTVDRLFSGSN